MITIMMMIQQSAPAGQTLVTPRPATLPQRDYRAQPQQTVVRASLAPLPPRQGDHNLHTSFCVQTSGKTACQGASCASFGFDRSGIRIQQQQQQQILPVANKMYGAAGEL